MLPAKDAIFPFGIETLSLLSNALDATDSIAQRNLYPMLRNLRRCRETNSLPHTISPETAEGSEQTQIERLEPSFER